LYNLTLKQDGARYISIIRVLLSVSFIAVIIRELFISAVVNIWFLVIVVSVFILLAWLERKARSPLQIKFSADNVIFNGMIVRKHSWSEIQNVVLKDGLLTVDFKNNKLMQRDIEEKINEAEFNSWVRKYL